MAMTWRPRWLNRSEVTINTTIQFIYIYRERERERERDFKRTNIQNWEAIYQFLFQVMETLGV